MKLLVTGAAGFIGSHVSDRLLREGHDVWGVDDLSTGRASNLSAAERCPSFRFHELDIVGDQLAQLVAEVQPDVVLHLAAQMDVRKSVADPLADSRVNVLGTVRVLDAVQRTGRARVVFASSGGTVYGEPVNVPVPEDAPLQPVAPYGAAKVAGEAYIGAYARLYGLPTCILRLGNVYGPRQDPHGEAGVVAIFLQAMLAGAATKIFGDGTSTRDYVYVDDVVDAVVRAAEGAGDGGRYNVGSGVGTEVRALHRRIASIVGVADEPLFEAPRTGELQRIVLDATAARDDLGWTPLTALDDGLRRTAETFAEV